MYVERAGEKTNQIFSKKGYTLTLNVKDENTNSPLNPNSLFYTMRTHYFYLLTDHIKM